MKKFRTPFNYDYKANLNTVVVGSSVTQPNMSLSIPEIILRFTRGTPPLSRTPGYNDEFIPDVSRMDFVEREDYMLENLQRIHSLKAEREAQAAKARKGRSDDSESRVDLLKPSGKSGAQQSDASEGS